MGLFENFQLLWQAVSTLEKAIAVYTMMETFTSKSVGDF